jgi:hypothetical protein
MVDIATGATTEHDPRAGKDAAAVELGRRGGLKGGKARAANLSQPDSCGAAKSLLFDHLVGAVE